MVGGFAIAAIGGLMWSGVLNKVPFGKLPGDVAIEKDGVSVYFPIVTMLLISGILSFILWLVGALRR